jgi:cytochrome c biogenesis protein CcmG/thiol:disulfide interchange protein DsbE
VSARLLGWTGAAVAAALILAALGWGLLHPATPATASAVGRPAPEIVVERLDGGQVRLSELRGRPVVLNFWASWCAPCRQEEDALKQAAQSRGDRVAFLGVDLRDSPQAARAYQERARMPYPVGPAAAGVPPGYGRVEPPQTFFIDPAGMVVAQFQGPLTGAAIERYLQLVGAS